MPDATAHLMRELDHRSSDGIDDRLLVAVSDAKTGEAFSVEVRDHARALEVFHHPYAYAARREITRAVAA